jgi:hypothetical protein
VTTFQFIDVLCKILGHIPVLCEDGDVLTVVVPRAGRIGFHWLEWRALSEDVAKSMVRGRITAAKADYEKRYGSSQADEADEPQILLLDAKPGSPQTPLPPTSGTPE